MAYARCAISGVLFEVSHMPKLKLASHEGFPHPIFAASHTFLQTMYVDHCAGKLDPVDSYLTFLAILHSSGCVTWECPCTLEPKSKVAQTLIENNISQLLQVIAKTEHIRHPKFKQPRLKISPHNSTLASLPSWIKACEENLTFFYHNLSSAKERNDLVSVQNKLKECIFSYKDTSSYSRIIADWADKATGGFPVEHAEQWKKTIAGCYDSNKMIKTNIVDLHAIKDYCCSNLEIGSIYFSELMACINAGIHRHTDYLGGNLFDIGYSLVDLDSVSSSSDLESTKEGKSVSLLAPYLAGQSDKVKAAEANKVVAKIIQDSPAAIPKREDYNDNLSYIKAKLAFNIAGHAKKDAKKLNDSLKGL